MGVVLTEPKRTTKFYRKNEKQVMHSFGLEPTKNSGSAWIEKADGQNENIICELKSTDKQSLSVKKQDILKLEYQAIVCKKIPLFAIQFLDSDETFFLFRPSNFFALAKTLEFPPTIDEKEKKTQETIAVTGGKKRTKKIKSDSVARQKFSDEKKAEYKKVKRAI